MVESGEIEKDEWLDMGEKSVYNKGRWEGESERKGEKEREGKRKGEKWGGEDGEQNSKYDYVVVFFHQ